MGLTVKANDKEWENAPQGMHPAVCIDVVDLGMERNEKWGKDQHKCRIVWQLPSVLTSEGKPFIVSKKFTVSLGEQSVLRPFLQSWRNRPFSLEELNGGFDLERLLGAPAFIQILHEPKKSGEGIWANVSAALPIPPGMQKPTAVPGTYTRVQDREQQPQPQSQAARATQQPYRPMDQQGVVASSPVAVNRPAENHFAPPIDDDLIPF